jgi:N-acyl-L-homoserine lactone synthetase
MSIQLETAAIDMMTTAIDSLRADDPIEAIVEAGELHKKLLALIGVCATVRRTHIRLLRAEGWTARQIGEEAQMTTQRVYQLESGADRKEKG